MIMNEIYTTIATSGICAILLAGVLYGVYKVATALIHSTTEMIKNSIFHVTIDTKDDNKKEGN